MTSLKRPSSGMFAFWSSTMRHFLSDHWRYGHSDKGKTNLEDVAKRIAMNPVLLRDFDHRKG